MVMSLIHVERPIDFEYVITIEIDSRYAIR